MQSGSKAGSGKLFRPLTYTQRKCQHNFASVASPYDPEADENVVCTLCNVRYIDHANAALKGGRSTEEITFSGRTLRSTRLHQRKQSEPESHTMNLSQRSAFVHHIQPEAEKLVVQGGGNIMYCEEPHYNYAVLLPEGTTRVSPDVYYLPSGEMLLLDIFDTNGSTETMLRFLPLHSRINVRQNNLHKRRKLYGPTVRSRR